MVPPVLLASRRRLVVRRAVLFWCALCRPLRRWQFRLLLGLAFANLVAGLALFPADVPLATRVAVDIVHVNFGVPLGAALVCAAACLGAGASDLAVAMRAAALAVLAWSALAVAATMAALAQAWHGDASVDAAAYCLGIFPGLGMHLAYLAALAVFGQALWRGWAGAAATTAIYLAVAVLPRASGVDHPLLQFGGPLVPWSDMAGFGPFLPVLVASAIVWSAASILLLAAARLLAKPWRSRASWTRLRPTAAVAWAAIVLGSVAGAWLLANDDGAPPAGIVQAGAEPQPRYARLTLDLEIHPRQRRVSVRGVAILAQEANAQARELHLALPAGLVLEDIAVTGERLPSAPRTVRFRLNRPLEPGETLRLAFGGALAAAALPRSTDRPRLLANGTAFAVADVVPVLRGPAAVEQEAQLQMRIGTTLDQVVVAAGEQVAKWREEGRSYSEFRTVQAVPLAASIHSGRYLRLASRNSAVVAFVQRGHRRLGEALLTRIEAGTGAAATALAGTQRLVEVPDFRRTFAAPTPRWNRIEVALAPRSAGGVVPVSELALLSVAAGRASSSIKQASPEIGVADQSGS